MGDLLFRISTGELDSPVAVVGGLIAVWPARSMNPGLLFRFLERHGLSLCPTTRDALRAIRLDDGTVLLRRLMTDFKSDSLDERRRLVAAHHQVRRGYPEEDAALADLIEAIVVLANQGQVGFDAGSFRDWCAMHARVHRDDLQPVV
jgi:hypothetical protein